METLYTRMRYTEDKKVYKEVDYTELKGDCVLVDVRSPIEHKEYTIPGAVNVPLFEDEERSQIGTVYKNVGTDEAKRLGIEVVSRRLPYIYDEILKLKGKHRYMAIFCERGGMRSSSICSLLCSLGVNTVKLKDGYKGYRAKVNELLPKLIEDVQFIVLHGHTGTGKTDVLEALANKGLEVINLEGVANHRGSQLGKVGLKGIVSQKQFEAEIFESLRRRKSDFVYIEAESGRIGNILVPKYIINKMKEGKHILLESDIKCRAKRIIEQYVTDEDCIRQLIEGVARLEGYIGKAKVAEYSDMILEGKYFEASVELMERYYDPLYYSSQVKYQYDAVFNSDDTNKAVEDIEGWHRVMQIILGCSLSTTEDQT